MVITFGVDHRKSWSMPMITVNGDHRKWWSTPMITVNGDHIWRRGSRRNRNTRPSYTGIPSRRCQCVYQTSKGFICTQCSISDLLHCSCLWSTASMGNNSTYAGTVFAFLIITTFVTNIIRPSFRNCSKGVQNECIEHRGSIVWYNNKYQLLYFVESNGLFTGEVTRQEAIQ